MDGQNSTKSGVAQVLGSLAALHHSLVADLVARRQEGIDIALLVPLGEAEGVLLKVRNTTGAIRVARGTRMASVNAVFEEGLGGANLVKIDLAEDIFEFVDQARHAVLTELRGDRLRGGETKIDPVTRQEARRFR